MRLGGSGGLGEVGVWSVPCLKPNHSLPLLCLNEKSCVQNRGHGTCPPCGHGCLVKAIPFHLQTMLVVWEGTTGGVLIPGDHVSCPKPPLTFPPHNRLVQPENFFTKNPQILAFVFRPRVRRSGGRDHGIRNHGSPKTLSETCLFDTYMVSMTHIIFSEQLLGKVVSMKHLKPHLIQFRDLKGVKSYM